MAPDAAQGGFVPPARIGPFRIDSVIGAGGMGIVYRAIAPDGRPAALKVLRSSITDAHTTDRFRREARMRIEHPNVIRTLDAGVDPAGQPWIAFELLEGETLEARLERGSIPVPEAVELGMQMCRGLAAVHQHGIVHRDLKPGNVFLCRDGTAKLLDFGIARFDPLETRLTQQGMVIGTPAYLAPEQARGEPDVDARADLWALGVVLYQALSGRCPFERDRPLATVLAVLSEEPESLTVLNPSVPEPLSVVVRHCLAKSRERRWRSAESLAIALRALHLTPPPDRRGIGAPVDEHPQEVILGEQRVVAVLLADGVHDIERFRSAVKQRGGIVFNVAGNRAVGLFGAESWDGDELTRAAEVALEARHACGRIALSSGRATGIQRGISGKALEAAERGCAAAVLGVAVDAETARALQSTFQIRRIGDGLCEIVSSDPSVDLAPGTMVGQPTVTLGRAAEIAQMREALETVVAERHPVCVLVSGPPGIGKSRLRDEMENLSVVASADARVLVGRAEPLRRDLAFSLLGNAIKRRLRLGRQQRGVPPPPPPQGVSDPFGGVVSLVLEAVHDPRRAIDCAELIGILMGIPPVRDSETLRQARLDPQLMTDCIRLALVDYLGGLAALGPLVLIAEDLQWADARSLDMLEELFDRLSDAPFLLFATARPELAERRPDLLAGRDVLRLEPRGLNQQQVAALATAIAARQIPEPLVRALTERTAGNPLFVEQIVMTLRDEGALDHAPATLPLPVTVEAAVQSRLDQLPLSEKELCKRASVLGRPFVAPEIEALGLAHPEPLLAALVRRDLLATRARARGPGREHLFRSALIADVAYGMLGDERRIELHRRAAAMLEAQAGTDAEEVAGHYERGNEPEKAARKYGAAALEATRRGDAVTALRCADRALALGAPDDLLFDLHMTRSSALRFLGNLPDQEWAIVSALGCASTDLHRARALTDLTALLQRLGRTSHAIDAGRDAVTAAREVGDPLVLALARGQQAAAFIYAGRSEEAEEALAEAIDVAPHSSPAVLGSLASWSAELAAARGSIGVRRDQYALAARWYAEAGDLRRAAGAEMNLADTLNRVGAYAEADAALRAALEKLRRVGHRLMEGYALLNLGYALTMLGRVDEAVAMLDNAGTLALAARDARLGTFVDIYHARALLAAGKPTEAAQQAEDRADKAEKAKLLPLRVGALTIAARARLVLGHIDAAVHLSGAALALRDKLGSVEEDEGEVFLVAARALEASGRINEAEAVLSRGRDRVEAIASRIADPELRGRFRRDVEANRDLLSWATTTLRRVPKG
ncbi:MAG: protein kinase [Deltaproteobacteria bacterium]|nr:protein kinase [Deltaproteobacteria bacterium]